MELHFLGVYNGIQLLRMCCAGHILHRRWQWHSEKDSTAPGPNLSRWRCLGCLCSAKPYPGIAGSMIRATIFCTSPLDALDCLQTSNVTRASQAFLLRHLLVTGFSSKFFFLWFDVWPFTHVIFSNETNHFTCITFSSWLHVANVPFLQTADKHVQQMMHMKCIDWSFSRW